MNPVAFAESIAVKTSAPRRQGLRGALRFHALLVRDERNFTGKGGLFCKPGNGLGSIVVAVIGQAGELRQHVQPAVHNGRTRRIAVTARQFDLHDGDKVVAVKAQQQVFVDSLTVVVDVQPDQSVFAVDIVRLIIL